MSKQLAFKLRTHGGKRRGAGRKPKGKTALVSHAARPRFARATPAYVTIRVRDDVPNLRASCRFAEVRRCFAASRGLHGARLIEFSVLSNHLHLIIEADDHVALSRGMQGLSVRIARALNRLLRRTGKLFADHFHARLLTSPTELVRAIRYVVENAAHHYGEQDNRCSSRAPENLPVLAAQVGWLLRVGWHRAS
jgi:REP element-mobilizing transposase RayT